MKPIALVVLVALFFALFPAHAQDDDLASCVALIDSIRANPNSTLSLPERYRDLRLIDTHNHDSYQVNRVIDGWDALYVDQTVIFGSISEPHAVRTDLQGMGAYIQHPDRVFPFFAAVDTYGENGVEQAQANLELGYYGIGEIVGASSYSPVTSNLAWKAEPSQRRQPARHLRSRRPIRRSCPAPPRSPQWLPDPDAGSSVRRASRYDSDFRPRQRLQFACEHCAAPRRASESLYRLLRWLHRLQRGQHKHPGGFRSSDRAVSHPLFGQHGFWLRGRLRQCHPGDLRPDRSAHARNSLPCRAPEYPGHLLCPARDRLAVGTDRGALR